MIIYFLLILIMTLLGSLASLFLKHASASSNLLKAFKNINLYIGGILYLFAAILNIYVLKYLDYSIVLPLTSLTYIWTMILSRVILKEKIFRKKVGGVFIILIGAILISV